MVRLPSRGQPTCLICLEEFRQEEFINGSALRLECNCRGDLALRHRDCVMKWVQVKGSNVCELCKAEIRNIPAPPPRAADPGDLPVLDEAYFSDPAHIHDFMPSSQDLVFDCIRVTWVAMIVSILFFEMSLGAALWTGLLAGMAYSVMVRLMYRSHFMAMRRLAEQQAAARREQEQEAAGPGAPGAVPSGSALPIVAAV
ncbi:zinc finger family [Micractinium conductrix]|uniref:Zinc finger family n=1 Tax=Micractinium conductrix TaxID=554055 RepID=A0A2P6VAS5_9CHLO|nr:zinc finger family [Micractinium conductrix]|eukprot:PSC71193.1 zinc finger family [Micractinium conductrix]